MKAKLKNNYKMWLGLLGVAFVLLWIRWKNGRLLLSSTKGFRTVVIRKMPTNSSPLSMIFNPLGNVFDSRPHGYSCFYFEVYNRYSSLPDASYKLAEGDGLEYRSENLTIHWRSQDAFLITFNSKSNTTNLDYVYCELIPYLIESSEKVVWQYSLGQPPNLPKPATHK